MSMSALVTPERSKALISLILKDPSQATSDIAVVEKHPAWSLVPLYIETDYQH